MITAITSHASELTPLEVFDTVFEHCYSFMNDDQCPQCLVRLPPTARSTALQITFLNVVETENLLDNQEELVSTPINVNFHPVVPFDRLSLGTRS